MSKTVERLLEYNEKKFITCSLDKLTILGDDTGSFEAMINNNNFGFIKSHGTASHPYKRYFACMDGSNIQWTDIATHKAIRYEFNPNKLNESIEREHRRAIASIIKTMKYPKVSRYDMAFDFYGYDFNKYIIHDKNSRKKNVWLDRSDQLETMYIGSPNADLRIRIYNKALEQKIETPLDWWRIELQFRDDACRSVQGEIIMNNQTIQISPCIPNLLETVRMYQPAYKQIESITERALVKLLIEEPETIRELSKNARTKYKKILSTLPSEKEIDLKNLFEIHHDKILSDIRKYLRIAERNDVLNKNKKIDIRNKEELELPINHEYYTQQDKEFTIESTKMHMLFNQ